MIILDLFNGYYADLTCTLVAKICGPNYPMTYYLAIFSLVIAIQLYIFIMYDMHVVVVKPKCSYIYKYNVLLLQYRAGEVSVFYSLHYNRIL